MALTILVSTLVSMLVLVNGQGACKSASHLMTSDLNECTTFCSQKISGVEDKASVEPKLYDYNGVSCCKCNYNRFSADMDNPTAPSGDPSGDVAYEAPGYDASSYESPSDFTYEAPSSPSDPPPADPPPSDPPPSDDPPKETPSPPPAPPVPTLDPKTFRPPYGPQLADASNPDHQVDSRNNEQMNYAVIQVLGMPWELPLSQQVVEAFIYAMSNVTGAVWQYRGAQPSVPGLAPFSPPGIPPLTDSNAPTAGAPPPPPPMPPPPAPVVPVPEPFVDPNLPTLPDPPIDPSLPLFPDPSTLPVSTTTQPVPTAPAVPASPTTAAPATPSSPVDLGNLKVDPTLFGRRLLSRLARTETYGRRMRSHDPNRADYVDDGCNCYGDYDNCECNGTADNKDYGCNCYGDYDNCECNGTAQDPYAYDSPSPDPYAYDSPSPDPYADGSENAYQDPNVQPSPLFPPMPVLPPPVLPPPPVVPSPPPPPPPAVILPPDMNGIWYFAVRSLDKTESALQTEALKSATGEATMMESLAKSGITVAKLLQTRYAGPDNKGVLDVTSTLDLDQLVGEAAKTDDDGGMSGATIGIIVGCVAGGLALIALIVALLISYNKRSKSKDRDSLTNQWKMEREMAESESKRLSASSTKSSIEGSLRWTASQQNGSFRTATTMTRDELERRRSLRAASAAGTSQRLADGTAFEPSPSKSSRLDSMRSALGLSRNSRGVSSPSRSGAGGAGRTGSAISDAEAESKRWNLFSKK